MKQRSCFLTGRPKVLDCALTASALLLLSVWPTTSRAQNASGTESPQLPVQIKTAPDERQPSYSVTSLSDQPATSEIRKTHALSIALRASGEVSGEENGALAFALKSFAKEGTGEDVSSIEAFLEAHPKSPWRISLLSNLGTIYFESGRLSKAMDAWERTWQEGKDSKDSEIRPQVDQAVAELAKMNARIGRYDRLESLFAELKGRRVSGAATELLTGAAEGLWLMTHRPQHAFQCGPMAVGTILALKDKNKVSDAKIDSCYSTQQGTSLTQIWKLAKSVGLNYQMAWRNPGAPILVPSVMNWKVGHFAALVKHQNGVSEIRDPTFGRSLWIRDRVVDDEASGYFLVPSGRLPIGWRSVDDAEGETVWGRGQTGSTNPDPTTPCDPKTGGCQLQGTDGDGATEVGEAMAVANAHLSVVSLNIVDTPLFYTPPHGLPIRFTVTYNQRDANQPAIFTYSNLGPKWTFDWLSYVVDNTYYPDEDAKLYVRGGGQQTYTGYTYTSSTTGNYAPELYSQAVLNRTSATSFERDLPDGSKEIFDVPDGTVGPGRKVFLSKIVPPQGDATTNANTITIHYDSSLRIDWIKDALGQTTTLSYLGADTKISQVTDPFGRFAKFEYDSSGHLQKITDMIGIVSQFTYTPDAESEDFISKMITPYGESDFTYGDILTDPTLDERTRWLQMQDPMGGRERVEFNELSTTNVSDYVPGGEYPNSKVLASVVPANMYNRNDTMFARNTYYWTKKEMMEAPGDYSKAHVYHWLHFDGIEESGAILESEKQPLENRIWYNYPGQEDYSQNGPPVDPITGNGPAIYQGSSTLTGTMNRPTIIGRVLHDGTTQTYKRSYNAIGNVTREVDPTGRTTTYKYDSVTTDPGYNIDLLAIYQENPSNLLGTPDSFGKIADQIAAFSNYNSLHEPQTITDAAGQITTYTYDSLGRKTTMTVTRNGAAEMTTWTYTGDYLTSVTGPIAGATTTFTYDSMGRVATVKDSEGYILTYNYDNLNRVIKVTYPDGTFTQTIYNRLDPEWQRDRMGRWTHRTYDALRRVTSVTDPQSHEVRYAWCGCGSLMGITDGNGNYTGFQQDIQGRLTQKTYANGGGESTTYDPAINLVHSVTQDFSTTTYAYNVDNTLAGMTYSLGTPPNVNFTYETAYPRLSTISTNVGGGSSFSTQYTYHYYPVTPPTTSPPSLGTLGANRVSAIDGPLANGTVSYTYDELGRVLSAMVNGVGTTVTYDALGRVATAAIPSLGSTNFNYYYVNQTSRLSSVTRPGGQSVNYTYFGNTGDQRLSEINNLGIGSTSISKFDYTYNPVGDIQTWTQQSGTADPTKYQLGYDGADELLSADLSDTVTSVAVHAYVYGYDAAGNRLRKQTDNSVTTSTVNNVNQLASLSAGGSLVLEGTVNEPSTVTVAGHPAIVDSSNKFHATVQATSGTNNIPITATDGSGNTTSKTATVTVSGTTVTPTYDVGGVGGNLTFDGTKTYTYDGINELVSIAYTGTSNTTQMSYDAFGRRIQIVEKTGSTITSTKNFVWIGNMLAEERDASNNVTKRFFAEGEQIGGVGYLFNKDHLGSIREMMDSTGAIRTRYSYDPYGQRTKVSGDLDADFGFTGDYYHSPSTLNLTLYRAYDANLGRWLSRDPLGIAGGGNLYGYVFNNTINAEDILGLSPLPIPDPNGVVPNGPWTPNGAPGVRPGNFLGPKSLSGRPQCQWVPPGDQGGPPGSNGYWKTNQPGQKGWDRYDSQGNPITPGQAHPGPPPTPTPEPEDDADKDARKASNACMAGGIGIGMYWTISELSRLFPLRNAVPLP